MSLLVGLKHVNKVELYGFTSWECANCKLVVLITESKRNIPWVATKYLENYIKINGCFANMSLTGGKDKTGRLLRSTHFQHTLSMEILER